MHKINLFINKGWSFTFLLWLVFFCYSICIALAFQNLIVPGVPSLHGVGKLLPNDAIKFDLLAWELANEIKEYGWNKWQLFGVSSGAMGNVSILAALYAVFGHDPSLIIPINASLHAFGGVLIFLLARELATKKNVGFVAGTISAMLFIILPSALMWYGQLHKDGYAIAGTLLLLLVWVKVIEPPEKYTEWLKLALASVFGILLVGIVRPYGLTLLFVVAIGSTILTVCISFFNNQKKSAAKQLAFFLMVIGLLVVGNVLTKKHTSQINLQNSYSINNSSAGTDDWHWQKSEYLPTIIDRYLGAVAKKRADLIEHGRLVGARSMIDEEIRPQSVTEIIAYLPRALQIATLSPFPTQWFSQLTVMRLIAVVEMLICYLCFIGIVFLLKYERKPAVWLTLFFITAFFVFLGFTISNMGTLFRLRYAYSLVLSMLGVLGWVSFLDHKGGLDRIVSFFEPQKEGEGENIFHQKASANNISRKKIVGSGVYVMGLTLFGFFGFFYRDILMARIFGLTSELDGFFIALLIPMTVVTIICMPIGSAFTPVFMKAKKSNSQVYIRSLISIVSGWVTGSLFVICCSLYFLVRYLLHYLPIEVEHMAQVQGLVRLGLPLLFLSGSVILGNAVLNAEGHFVVTGLAALIVPFVVIVTVFICGNRYGVESAMVGMVVGQIFNLGIVQFYMYKHKYTLFPQFFKGWSFSPFVSQYFPLVASAFFVSITLLINMMLAMGLAEGSISIFNLGNKGVVLLTGLIGSVVSTVMLPYFSTLVDRNKLFLVRKELSVFLLFLTFFITPVGVVFFVWAEPIIGIVFASSRLASNEIASIAEVMQYAVIQLPFFACNILLLKFSTALKHVYTILLIAFLGLLIDIGAVLFLMKFMGVAGIALGASISMVMTTIFLTASLVCYRHVSLMDFVVIVLNWMLFITLIMSVHFNSLSGVLVTIGAYLILLCGYGKQFLEKREKQYNESYIN